MFLLLREPASSKDGSGANGPAPSVTVAFGELRTNSERTEYVEELFRGRHSDREVIILCVRRYVTVYDVELVQYSGDVAFSLLLHRWRCGC